MTDNQNNFLNLTATTTLFMDKNLTIYTANPTATAALANPGK